ncbi:MAG: hypothetical protein WC708_08635 [Lentisphaeria bacterium]
MNQPLQLSTHRPAPAVLDLTAGAPPFLAAVEHAPPGTAGVLLPFPPARDPREFARLLKAAKRTGLLTLVAHPLLCQPAWARAMEWLASGVLGPLTALEVVTCEPAAAGEAPAVASRRNQLLLSPAHDLVLRLLPGQPALAFQAGPGHGELRSHGDGPAVRLEWRPRQPAAAPTVRLLAQGPGGQVEVISNQDNKTIAELRLASGREQRLELAGGVHGELAAALLRSALARHFVPTPLVLASLAPLYSRLER